jgi:DUF971 family protein
MINNCTTLYELKNYEHNSYYDDQHKNRILRWIYLVESNRNSNIRKDVNILCQ